MAVESLFSVRFTVYVCSYFLPFSSDFFTRNLLNYLYHLFASILFFVPVLCTMFRLEKNVFNSPMVWLIFRSMSDKWKSFLVYLYLLLNNLKRAKRNEKIYIFIYVFVFPLRKLYIWQQKRKKISYINEHPKIYVHTMCKHKV